MSPQQRRKFIEDLNLKKKISLMLGDLNSAIQYEHFLDRELHFLNNNFMIDKRKTL